MTQVARGRGARSIQSVIILIFFLKKIIILNFFKKLSRVFIDYQGCIWIYEIDRFKSS